MTTSKIALLAGVALIGLSTVAHAETTNYRGFYLEGFGGYSHENGQETTPYSVDAGAPIGTTNEIQYSHSLKNSWTAGGTGGWNFGNGFLMGAEYNYNHHDVQSVDDGAGTLTHAGQIRLQTVMAKGTYELPVALFGFLRPYAGAGAGGGYAKYKNIDASGFRTDDSGRYVFAYEGFGGLAFDILPRLEATVEYKYLATSESHLKTDTPGIKTNLDQGSHNALLGLRYQFGAPVTKEMPAPAPAPMVAAPAPRPAAPVAQAPAVPQTYIVFFDFDKSALTPEAQKVLERAAQDVRVGKGARIQVVGHADRSGSNNYNQRLSERRATVVKAELVRLGVNNGQIATRGAGENEPRVPTADGVREAQNRRAEIIFQ